MYATHEQDHEKRKNQEGSYSVYNYMYHYLMDNYEPVQVDNMPSMQLESLEHKLVNLGKEYCLKGGNKADDQELAHSARSAMTNFVANDGQHGDTANNLGKRQDNSFATIRDSISDLKW